MHTISDVHDQLIVLTGRGVGKRVFRPRLRYYPFVGVENGEICVGVRSSGRCRIPTGTVQIRVDCPRRQSRLLLARKSSGREARSAKNYC